MKDAPLEEIVANLGKSFLSSLFNRSSESDYNINQRVYHFIVEKPTQNIVILDLSSRLLEDISFNFVVTEEAYCFVQRVKSQLDPIIKSSDNTHLEIALNLSEIIKQINLLFYGEEGFNIYQNLGMLNYTFNELKEAVEYGKKLIETKEDTYHLTLSAEVLEDLCKIEDVAYNFFKTKGILKNHPFQAIHLEATHFALPRALTVTKNPTLYNKIKEIVDPNLGVEETDDELKNIKRYFEIISESVNTINIQIRTTFQEFAGLIRHMKTYSPDSPISIDLAGKYLEEEFVVVLFDSEPKERTQIFTYMSEEAKYGFIAVKKSQYVIDYAARIRDYLDAQLNRLTQVDAEGVMVNIANLAESNNGITNIQRTVQMLFTPENERAAGIFYCVVKNPQEKFGIENEFKVRFNDVPVRALSLAKIRSHEVTDLYCKHKDTKSNGKLIKAFEAMASAEKRHREIIKSTWSHLSSSGQEAKSIYQFAGVKYEVLRAERIKV